MEPPKTNMTPKNSRKIFLAKDFCRSPNPQLNTPNVNEKSDQASTGHRTINAKVD